MRPFALPGYLLLVWMTVWCPVAGADEITESLRTRMLVVYNENDPDSERLARLYMDARNIPKKHILGIKAPAQETVTRQVYEENIRGPIDAWAESNGFIYRTPQNIRFLDRTYRVEVALANQLRVIVLIRGVPLRITEDETRPAPEGFPSQLVFNRAAVDSELAAMPMRGIPLHGFIANPYFSRTAVSRFRGSVCDFMVLVTRLDGPTAEDVERVIHDSIAAEKRGLMGRAYFDTRGITDPANNYIVGDDWLRNSAARFRQSRFAVHVDEAPEVVGDAFTMPEAAIYAGWYTEHVNGPFLQPGFRFEPGAVAYHIHSFSAASLREANRRWSGPLIQRGAAATMGSVYEPYLQYTPHVDIFFLALLEGLTFAEAAYLSQPVLSWQVTMIGDPLYRPFKRR